MTTTIHSILCAAERLGQTELTRRLRQQQIHAIERHLEWVPEDVRARILLAANHAFFQKRNRRDAGATQSCRAAPERRDILYNAACVYGILQKKTEAMALLKKQSRQDCRSGVGRSGSRSGLSAG